MKSLFKILLVPLMLAALVGCNLDTSAPTKSGSVTLTFSMSQSKTLLPGISMVPSSYVITGAGPNGADFSVSTHESPVTVDHLETGDWSITVEAINDTGIKIGTGTSEASVSGSDTTRVSVTVRPVPGFGSIELAVFWNAAATSYPDISSQLIPPRGSAIELDFGITNGSTGSCFASDIPTGYYTMILHLLDMAGGSAFPALAMGAVEVVRIVNEQTTSGQFDFTDSEGGIIEVDIIPDMEDPLTVVISGGQSEIGLGDTMNPSASVTEDVGNVIYVWYVNGLSAGTGSDYAADASAVGTYRLDVTAFTADGTRAGSATHEYRVVDGIAPTDPPLPPVTFEFDPPYPEAGQTVNVRVTSYEYLFNPSIEAVGPLATYDGYDREYFFNYDGTTTYSFNLYYLPGNDYQIVFNEEGMEKGRTSLSVSGSVYPFLTVNPDKPVGNQATTFYAVSTEPHAYIHLVVIGSDGQEYSGNDWGWELIDGLYWWHWAYDSLPYQQFFDCTLTIEGNPRAQMRIYPVYVP